MLAAVLITPLVIRLAHRFGAVAQPGLRTIHKNPIPRIGGVAIFVAAMALIVSVLFLNNAVGKAFRSAYPQILTLLIAAAYIFAIGLMDDLRGLPARFKLLAELLAAGALCFAGVRINNIAVSDTWVLQLGWWGIPLTLLWITGITNAVNLSDGLDGLAAGISAVACGVIAIFALSSGDQILAVMMLALVGSLCGFLVFNWNPAKVFMGDCGSLFVGFTIAAASVMCIAKSAAFIGLALPILALGIPIFDTFFSMLRRFLERRSLFAPDRSHFHHRLLDMGLTQRHVVLTIYAATLVFTGLGLFMMVSKTINAIVVFACVLVLILVLFRVVGAVRLRQTTAALRAKYTISQRQKRERQTFENMQLRFRQVENRTQWWQAICEAAQRMDFVWISLRTTHPDGRVETEIWRSGDAHPDLSHLITMRVPLAGDDGGPTREFEIALSATGSLEAASHRATLFGRLLDENGALGELGKGEGKKERT
jgi:UDP-GlcNAc:undecaprenyl-phosphate GlcNAc-1-phosphate transferase